MASALAEARVSIDPDVLAEFCRRNHIKKLSLYGSVLREDFRPESDIDVLVAFEEGHRIGLFGFGGIAADLEDMIGREVDLKTLGDFPPRLHDSVLSTSETIYASD